MLEAVVVLVVVGILTVEIIEIRHKCDQFPAGIWERTPSYPGVGLRDGEIDD